MSGTEDPTNLNVVSTPETGRESEELYYINVSPVEIDYDVGRNTTMPDSIEIVNTATCITHM